MDKKLSLTFDWLRFPLIVLVVFIHTFQSEVVVNGENMGGGSYPIYQAIGQFISNGVARIAVPLFFFVSGYLYFKEGLLTKYLYINKSRSRVKSLLIPYLLWNVWMILFMILYQWIGTKMGYVFAGKFIQDYSWNDLLRAFWDCGGRYYPICFQLWFIRDLILICSVSPLIYVLLRNWGNYILFFLFLSWLFDWWPPIFPNAMAVFFFSLGAGYKLRNCSYIDAFSSRISRFSLFYPIFLTVSFLIKNDILAEYIAKIGIILGAIMVINLVYRYATSKTLNPIQFLSAASFFVYAFHEPIQGVIKKILYLLIQPNIELNLIFIYFMAPLFTVSLGLGTYYMLQNYLPRFLKVINGR